MRAMGGDGDGREISRRGRGIWNDGMPRRNANWGCRDGSAKYRRSGAVSGAHGMSLARFHLVGGDASLVGGARRQ